MYTQPKPLTPARFYILLALAHGPLHGYRIQGATNSNSLSSVDLPSGTLYPLLARLADEGLIEYPEPRPGRNGSAINEYEISRHGLLALKQDLRRQRHAVQIAQARGLFDDTVPLDIQALL
jgi:DNA-binding PadR family transcriptional regulator